MRLAAIVIPMLVLSAGAIAQVKDANGNDLRVGLPDKAIRDFNGGMISKGRPAKCVIDDQAAAVCTFYPRNGDGSFAIDVDGDAYYAEKTSVNSIDVDMDGGRKMFAQGSFTRSKRDPACWVQRGGRKICVY